MHGYNPSMVPKPAVFASVAPRGALKAPEVTHAHLVLSGKHLTGAGVGAVCPISSVTSKECYGWE